MNKEELEQAFNETTNNAVDLLKENIELKKKYTIMKENAYTLAKRIDKAIEYINTFWKESNIAVYDKEEDTYLEEPNAINKLLNILKGSDKE